VRRDAFFEDQRHFVQTRQPHGGRGTAFLAVKVAQYGIGEMLLGHHVQLFGDCRHVSIETVELFAGPRAVEDFVRRGTDVGDVDGQHAFHDHGLQYLKQKGDGQRHRAEADCACEDSRQSPEASVGGVLRRSECKERRSGKEKLLLGRRHSAGVRIDDRVAPPFEHEKTAGPEKSHPDDDDQGQHDGPGVAEQGMHRAPAMEAQKKFPHAVQDRVGNRTASVRAEGGPDQIDSGGEDDDHAGYDANDFPHGTAVCTSDSG
jgi:hypothetical protein